MAFEDELGGLILPTILPLPFVLRFVGWVLLRGGTGRSELVVGPLWTLQELLVSRAQQPPEFVQLA